MPQTPHREALHRIGEDPATSSSECRTVTTESRSRFAAGLWAPSFDPGRSSRQGWPRSRAASRSQWDSKGLSRRATGAEHYASELAREKRETVEMPAEETKEVVEVFESYGLPHKIATEAAHSLREDRTRWVDFMMRFELGLERPDPTRARTSALTIALSYIAGGFVPLAPYFFLHPMRVALSGSVALTLLALLVFGYVKGRFTVKKRSAAPGRPRSSGGLAAAACALRSRKRSVSEAAGMTSAPARSRAIAFQPRAKGGPGSAQSSCAALVAGTAAPLSRPRAPLQEARVSLA
jgi:hypothetical protein